MKNYIAIILFLALFLIESLIGRTFYQPTDFACEELAANQMGYWIDYMIQYCLWKAVFMVIMVTFIPILMLIKVKLDLWDWCVLGVWWATEIITVVDWKINGNTRQETVDWWVITSVLLLLILFKIKMYGIRNKRTGIY